MPYPNELAGNGTKGGFTPHHLFAGEKEIVTNNGSVAANQDLKQFQVVAMNAAGELVAHDPAASDGTEKAVAVMAQPVKTTAATAPGPYYVSAFFNHEALVWHATLDTLAKRKAALLGTEIQVGKLYGGNW
jgi:hypothetical protein